MLRLLPVAVLAAASAVPAYAQFTMQNSGTDADLRGIVNAGNGTAWASGTHGTVLRTEDGGYMWQGCAMPPGAENLDFRGIQAYDDQTAIVMSSGKGDLSRVYKTTDGCNTWKLVFTNPDADGFWDAIDAFNGHAILIGDPVKSRFVLYASDDGKYEVWKRFGEQSSAEKFRLDLDANSDQALFAASNSILLADPGSHVFFVTGGEAGALCSASAWLKNDSTGVLSGDMYQGSIPLAKSATGGAFSLAARLNEKGPPQHVYMVTVGGDYKLPDATAGTAAWSKDNGEHWHAASVSPHGYRSAVAYDGGTKTWITVGPNGTDVSTDDGHHWRPLKPGNGDEANSDKQWNALSLPYVVGPHGRIGRLRDDAFKGR